MRILAVSVLVIVALLNSRSALVDARSIEWRYFDNPSGAAPQALSERMVARHLLEAEDALADLESEDDDSGQGYNACPAPNRDVVKTAIQDEIERLKNDPSAFVGNENEVIRDHRALLEAYDNLRQARGSSLAKSSFVENVANAGADDRNANVEQPAAAENDGGDNVDEANIDEANVDEANVDEANVDEGASEDGEDGQNANVDGEHDDANEDDEAGFDDAEYEGEDSVHESEAEPEGRVRVKRNPQYEQSEEEFGDDGEVVDEDEDQDLLEEEEAGYQPDWQQANFRAKRAN